MVHNSSDRPQINSPAHPDKKYDHMASQRAGNSEVRDILSTEVHDEVVAAWNLAIDALHTYGRPVLVTEHERTRAKLNRRFMTRSTGLIQLPGTAGEDEVQAIRLSAAGGVRPEKVTDLEEWRPGGYKSGSIYAELVTARLATLTDRDNKNLKRVSETYLPAAMSRLPQASLVPALMAARPKLEVVTTPLPFPGGTHASCLLTRPYLPTAHWDVGSLEKVDMEVTLQTEKSASHISLYPLAGLLGDLDPLRDNPGFRRPV